jgi:hypothetical protein
MPTSKGNVMTEKPSLSQESKIPGIPEKDESTVPKRKKSEEKARPK